MAVSKLWKVTHSLKHVIDYAQNHDKTENKKYTEKQLQALSDVLAYAKNEEKTEQEFFVQGINCNPSTARDQFITVKEQYDKTDGIQAYHGYLSFKERDLPPATAQKIGMEFAKRVWGDRFQVVVTTHLNAKHLHCHFVVNSVSMVDGKRLQNEEKAWFSFRHIVDELCKEYGLHYIDNPERNRDPYFITKKTQAGMPTRQTLLKEAIDEAIACSKTKVEFDYAMKQMGYTLNWNPRRKYMTALPKGSKQPIRLYRLGEDYTEERIMERLRENRSKVILEPFQKKTYRPRQSLLLTREDKIRKVGGLYGLYLHYCYLLGVLPKYKKQSTARLHYLLKDDLMKLDELTAQVTLLGKHHIATDEQLFSYRQSVTEEIKTLTNDRTHLRNKIRKVNIDDAELSGAKAKISDITERLKTLRKELRICDGIATRSGVIRDNVVTILADEEKLKRKENYHYEHRR